MKQFVVDRRAAVKLEALRLGPALARVLKACVSLRLEAAGHSILFLDLSVDLQMLRVMAHCLALW